MFFQMSGIRISPHPAKVNLTFHVITFTDIHKLYCTRIIDTSDLLLFKLLYISIYYILNIL